MKPDAPYRYYPDLLEMARDVEIMVVITPGGSATTNLVNEAVLEALGPQGLLVNVARGSVVDMEALIDCLKDGRLRMRMYRKNRDRKIDPTYRFPSRLT